MKEGDVVLAPIPQADGSIKNRPVIVLREMPRYRDLLVCGISTQLHQRVNDFDELVLHNDADFATSGLLAESLIRLGFLAMLPRRNIPGVVGAISSERHKRLLKRLSDYLLNLQVLASSNVMVPYTRKQGQYLAFIYYYTRVNGIPPTEADMQRYFKTTPPSVHQMVLTLEKRGFIHREPRKPRTIQVLLPREQLPDLE
jgi:mRNA interferase MazF